jgi:two-component system C4-dicarboxylate transport response regulator DctD
MTPPRRTSIVIVEDHASLLGALHFALQADGFDVHAFDRAAPLIAAPPHADCIVVDMRLPDIDGLTLIARLREKGIWAPAILTTTNPDRRTRRTADDMGVLIVEKPLVTGELRALIDDLVAANSS